MCATSCTSTTRLGRGLEDRARVLDARRRSRAAAATVSVRYGNGPDVRLEVGDRRDGPVGELVGRRGRRPAARRRSPRPPGVVASCGGELRRDADVPGHRLRRRPGAAAASGGGRLVAWSPVIRTVSSSGAETRTVTSAAGLVAVSPPTSTNGSSAQPTPGSQASSGRRWPTRRRRRRRRRGRRPAAQRQGEVQLHLGGLPGRQLVLELDDVEAAGLGRPRVLVPSEATSSPRTSSTTSRLPPRPSRGRWAPTGRPARGRAGPA